MDLKQLKSSGTCTRWGTGTQQDVEYTVLRWFTTKQELQMCPLGLKVHVCSYPIWAVTCQILTAVGKDIPIGSQCLIPKAPVVFKAPVLSPLLVMKSIENLPILDNLKSQHPMFAGLKSESQFLLDES